MRRCWLALVVLPITLCGCWSGGGEAAGSSATTDRGQAPPATATASPLVLGIHTDPSRTRRGRVPRGGSSWVRVRYPRGWYGDASAETLAVTSYPVHEPDQAVRALPSDGAFIYVIDYPAYSVSTRRSPSRPQRISLTSPGSYDVFGKAYRIEFRDHHHGILAFVALGDHASSEMRATAVTVLNSISVSR
jgi:hypothetical protein